MTAPFTVFVNIAVDRAGKPRGFEKSAERFHFLEGDAQLERDADPVMRSHFTTVECVIMSKAHYDALVSEGNERFGIACQQRDEMTGREYRLRSQLQALHDTFTEGEHAFFRELEKARALLGELAT